MTFAETCTKMTRRLGFLLGACVLAASCAAGRQKAEGEAAASEKPAASPSLAEMLASAARSDVSYYLTMRDGVKVAISLYFPDGKPPAQPATTLLIMTRYGRAGVAAFGEGGAYQHLRAQGYVIAALDTRGSTASFGPREAEFSPAEVEDMDEVVAHLASRPWSDGNVIATGVSYMADTADLATSRPAPALKGAVIREVDFDIYSHLITPGGVANDWMMEGWAADTYRRDVGQSVDPTEGKDCIARVEDCPALWPRLQPVDADADFSIVRQALAGRKRWTAEDYTVLDYRDDAPASGLSLFGLSPAARLADIRAQAKPAQVWGTWVDGGTAEAALARYRSAPDTPMEIWITGNNHGNGVFADPFFPDDKTPRPAPEAQLATMQGFFDRAVRGIPVERMINYYVLGADEFRTTKVWPPTGMERRTFYLDAGGLADEAPTEAMVDRYDVDFSATTGEATRWSTQFGTAPDYPDRADADRKLIVYDSAPFSSDMEIAGNPVVTLYVATQTADPAFHVYLEDVSPEGRVTYITEGLFRAIHRKKSDLAALPYDQGEMRHTFRRADGLPVKPGEMMEVEFALFPVAAKISAGHRLRLAVAGADAGIFRRYSEGKPEVFCIQTGAANASNVAIDIRGWRAEE